MPTSSWIRIPRISNVCNFFFRACQFRNLQKVVEKISPRKRNKFRSIRAVFWPLVSMRSEETSDSIADRLPSMSADQRVQAALPSPVTPAYIAAVRLRREREGGAAEAHDEVEEVCRSFENYLMEMLVEEGMVRDLMDVEELLDCWDGLKCPEFIELVCRFYGELCKDLFSSNENVADKKLTEK